MVNKYPATCIQCKGAVAVGAGNVRRSKRGHFYVLHPDCASGGPGVNTITFASGETFTRNKRGRCEDAPCCGCCTI